MKGRPKLPDGRTAAVCVRLTRGELAALRAMAKDQGIPVGEVMRRAVFGKPAIEW